MTPQDAILHLFQSGYKVTELEPGTWSIEDLSERADEAEMIRLAKKCGSQFKEVRVANDV